MKKYSIIASDYNPDYLFFAPMTCAFWKNIDYNPYFVMVDHNIDPKIKDLVVEYSNEYVGKISYLNLIPGYRTCNLAQICRLFVSADPYFSEDDYILLSDMDEFPLSYQWFNFIDQTKSINAFDPDELNYKRLKMGYIGMQKKVWKEVIGIEESDLNDAFSAGLRAHLHQNSDWNTGWNMDEYILTNSVFNSRFYPNDCQMIVRGPGRFGTRKGRIDRTFWKQTIREYLYTNSAIDTHLTRNPYGDEAWEDIKTIIRFKLGTKEEEKFDEYRTKFVELL